MNGTWMAAIAALLLGGFAGCDRYAQDVAEYRTLCLVPDDAVREAERSRNGISARCDESVLARRAPR